MSAGRCGIAFQRARAVKFGNFQRCRPGSGVGTRRSAMPIGLMKRPIIRNVQLLRFVAALGVVISHSAALFIPRGPATAWFWAVPWTGGVDLFFVISGFVMLCLTHDAFGQRHAAGDFLWRRLVRIVPPYWFFTTVTVLAAWVAGGRLKGTTIDLVQLVTSYGFLPWPRGDGKLNPILAQGWTLNHEIVFYVAFAAALCARRGLALLCAGFVLLALLHPFVPARFFIPAFWTRPIILEFLGGILLARLYLTGFRLPTAGAVLGGVCALSAFVVTAGVDFGAATRVIHLGIPALLLGGSVILLPDPQRPGALHRALQAGGDASYTLYLAHYGIVNAVALVWQRLGLGLPWLGVLAGIVVSIGVALVFFRRVERPVTQRLQRLISRRGPSRLDGVAP
jgi:exopolysaccharide production protein ExoZ